MPRDPWTRMRVPTCRCHPYLVVLGYNRRNAYVCRTGLNRGDAERVYLEQQGYVRVALGDFLNVAVQRDTAPAASPAFELEVCLRPE